VYLPSLLNRVPRGRPLIVRLLSATGFGATVPIFLGALATILLARDSKIEGIGPLRFQPSIPTILLVPLLLSISCGVAHSTWSIPVVQRSWRVHAVRAMSYLVALVISACIAGAGGRLAGTGLVGGMMRDLLWMAGATMATTALVGITYAWLPVVLISGTGVLSSPSDDPWTLYGMLFHPTATHSQLAVAAAACVAGLAVGIWDPVSRGYLRQPLRGGRGGTQG
jgi:hypothetical protein